ncbi:MAG: hypothetical protein ACRDD1_11605, partial [Planctomycetia bacterium]
TVAQGWFRRWVQEKTSDLGSLSKTAVEDLAVKLAEEIKDPSQADVVKRTWLETREEQLRDAERIAAEAAKENGRRAPVQDAAARVEFAQRYLEWFGKSPEARAKAVSLCMEAARIEPTLTSAADALRSLGYFRARDGKWTTADAAGGDRSGDAAVGVRLGMARSEVLRSMGGKPDRVSRMATSERVSQQWTYGEGGRGTRYLMFVETNAGDVILEKIYDVP